MGPSQQQQITDQSSVLNSFIRNMVSNDEVSDEFEKKQQDQKKQGQTRQAKDEVKDQGAQTFYIKKSCD